MSADGGTTSIGTEDITMIDGTITDRAISELLINNNGYHFQMSGSGDGFNIVSSAGGASFMEQDKWGNLNYEVIDGVRTNQSSYNNSVEIVGLYEFNSSEATHDEARYRMTRFINTGDFLIDQYSRYLLCIV
ncbi:hypothetical protein [uncultured Gimesia sp.]|uniref:hypothetical protein n=1 Tax=uncultured Gimesia sp. TaxID=1678688 RepID=UPI002610E3CD|nr:hypothetical protein [uncultured Gimesia sp.]